MINLRSQVVELTIEKDYLRLVKQNRVIFAAEIGDSPQQITFDEAWKTIGQLLQGFDAACIQ